MEEHNGLSECITAVVTIIVGAVIRIFEKRKMRRASKRAIKNAKDGYI
jgi:hypothetical protein